MTTIFRRLGGACLIAFASALPVAMAAPPSSPAAAIALAQRIEVVIDTDEQRTDPVPHRYLHGTVLDDAKFQMLLPANWNGKVVIHTRGFSGTEFSTGAFLPAALAKGYAFAASDEGWNRVTIPDQPEDSYYESRQRLVELTVLTNRTVWEHYGRRSSRTLIMGGSNGGHHTKWMVEDFPQLYDGGVAGYGYNSSVSQWGGVAQVVRNIEVIQPRLDDIIARRAAQPDWDPFTEPLDPPLNGAQLQAMRDIYDIPAVLRNGFRYNAGRLPGSEPVWKEQYPNLVGYLRDSIRELDPSFNPNGGEITDEELGQWDPRQSPRWVKQELRLLDLTGRLQRPVIIMHGTYDATVSPLETAGYKALVERVLGREEARRLLAVYYIPGMGHGGAPFNDLVDEQIDALEAWIDWQRSGGTTGSPPPERLGDYPREP